MHKHSYELDPEDRGFNGPGSPVVWFRCKNIAECLDPYELAPRGLMYHALLGRDQDMWLEYLASEGKDTIEWRDKGWLAFPQRQPWCDECSGPYPLDQWPGSQYAGHWDTCPNRWAAIGVEAIRVRARENDPSSSSS